MTVHKLFFLLVLCTPIMSACSKEPASAASTAPAAPAPDAAASAATDVAVDAPGTEPVAQGARSPDVIYVPTPEAVVDSMLDMARVDSNTVLYDLGSGDGRIPIAAAKKYGIRAVGIDIDPERIREANANAEAAGVTDLVTFREEDLFEADISEATVVTLYLLQSLNVRLRPKLLSELKPGTRIVSHSFDMADQWDPEETRRVDNRNLYLWTVPRR